MLSYIDLSSKVGHFYHACYVLAIHSIHSRRQQQLGTIPKSKGERHMNSAHKRTIKGVAVVACMVMVLTVYWSSAVAASVSPDTFSATVKPTESASDPVKVDVPASAPKADVLFIFDTTGSMSGALASAKTHATEIMNSFATTDIAFGVVDHRDYEGRFSSCSYDDYYGYSGDYPYKLDQSVTTSKDSVQSAINGLSIGSGADGPESYSRTLYESYSDPTIGWRDGAKKVVVYLGDSVPHDCTVAPWGSTGADPGRDATVSTADDLKFTDVLNGMKTNNEELLFVDYGSGALDWWNTQAAVTGGSAYSSSSTDFVTLIVAAINEGLATPTVDTLKLQASSGYESWLTASDPASYSGDTGKTVDFTATITVPDGTAPGDYKFTLSAVDKAGVSYGEQAVTITVPNPVITVPIDIQPGASVSAINMAQKGLTPVAILSTDKFDATKVDPTSVTFGPGNAKVVKSSVEDVNADGLKDMMVWFTSKDTGFGTAGPTTGTLTGQTTDGQKFTGSDSVKIVLK